MRLAKEDRLEEALYLWFLQKRSQGIAVNGPLLAKKAEELHKSMELPSEFMASSGWLWRFCRRHGIRELSLEGEKLSAEDSGIEIFRNKLQDTLEQEGLTLEQLYNCNETGLQYRMLPDKTLACRHEKGAAGMKKQKDRVTLMACSNATGKHKLPLVCIGKSRNPRCFKNINKDALPVRYYAQRSAWMDCSIFTTWFQNEFVPSVKKYLRDNKLSYKALLLLDNAPSHPSSDVLRSSDGNIMAMYLPPNTTSLIQPMDQGVLVTVKRHYKRALLHKLLLVDNNGHSMVSFVKTIDMKDVVYFSAASWEQISSLTLSRSWLKLLGSHSITSKNPEEHSHESAESALPPE